MPDPIVYLKPNAIAEPLINQWYAWSYLIPPATAACYITQSHLKVMESFIQAPQVHVTALNDPAMRGGPFIDYPVSNVNNIKALYDRTVEEQAHLLDLYQAIQELDALLDNATGESLEPLYEHIPAPLKGYVELVYDRYHRPSFRLLEGLLYRSDYYRTDSQAIALYLGNEDDRAFVLSTPRLDAADSVQINLPFADPRWDELFRMRQQGRSRSQMQSLFASIIPPSKTEIWSSLFTTTPPTQCQNYRGNDIRIRYLGHACVLIETDNVSILCDPIISYHHQMSYSPRYSFSDLPETIDYVLITHNHQDHIMFESLLQLRHKVKTIVVPKSNKEALIDPSLKSILNTIGFTNILDIDELENIPVPQGEIVSLPVLGEHGDLNIGAKNAYLIRIGNRSILCAADSNNIDPSLYDNLHDIFGDLDILFIGMECEGAPFTWAYESLLGQSLNRRVAATRRLDGSNARRATELVDKLRPKQVYVYAMGQEPWLNFITSIVYTDDSIPIIESNKLVQYCQQIDIISERLFGCKEIMLEMGSASPQSIGKSRTRKLDNSVQPSHGKTPPQPSP